MEGRRLDGRDGLSREKMTAHARPPSKHGNPGSQLAESRIEQSGRCAGSEKLRERVGTLDTWVRRVVRVPLATSAVNTGHQYRTTLVEERDMQGQEGAGDPTHVDEYPSEADMTGGGECEEGAEQQPSERGSSDGGKRAGRARRAQQGEDESTCPASLTAQQSWVAVSGE